MTDRELEKLLRAWYDDEVGATVGAPADLRESLAAIPLTTPAPLRPITRRRSLTLLAAAAVLVVGGALAAGSGFVRLTAEVTPSPSADALVPSISPLPSETASPTATVRAGDVIAFTRMVDKPERKCSVRAPACPTPRLWIVRADGTGAHEMFPDGVGYQSPLGLVA